ncbi:MAG TPA: MXAN_6230/SCO0854 family RING domain-containing protein [Kofleriaceae bacterium]|jgi:hypothetical protein|nr:MXAN_6230/SCO0854 family RING domain-containing protein [Kofleriaceae bacterium]
MENQATRDVLLKRQGLVFLDDQSEGLALPAAYVQAIEANLAQLGYVPTTRLAQRMTRLAAPALGALQRWIWDTLAAHLGAGRKHEPLFRSFPDGIPVDTFDLWIRKVVAYYAQADGQPCRWCQRVGTTHVLQPCHHVICDHCFDGASYSACPACEQPVDRASPFFQPARRPPAQRPEDIRFKLLDVGDDLDAAARALFAALCARTQAMAPDDRDALVTVVRDYRDRVLAWLPAKIPVRENVAWIFGTLFQLCAADAVLAEARRFLTTATDVLRLIAVYSGADASLQRQVAYKTVEREVKPVRWWGAIAKRLWLVVPAPSTVKVPVAVQSYRFKVGKLRRPMRRALLALLDAMPADRLVEDMLRHQSSWVWVGEFLHPHEHARRFPAMARAFQVVRGKAPDGTPAPAVQTFHGRVAAAAQAGDATAMVGLLRERPGELARRFDHVLRIAGDDVHAVGAVMAAFEACVPAFATPVLVTLRSHLATRGRRAPVRVYWPKGAVAVGYSADDTRPALRADAIAGARRRIDDELMRRFAAQPGYPAALLDFALWDIIVPFNERTASRAAIALPRGSRVPVPDGKLARMFVHWCEPERGGETTDIDLSVAFYDASWRYLGVCSYYQLKWEDIATSSGDLRAGPFPDGASEFVDVDRRRAQAADVRYAVMVVNNYAGMPFAQLERGFAGLMLRDDAGGEHFDPRTVALRFDLAGGNGIFVPLVFDLETDSMHWLDVYSRGELAFNNVETSNRAITRVCPNLISYFSSGARPAMFELAALHAAARTRRVIVRDGASVTHYVRDADEAIAGFAGRILDGRGGVPGLLPGADEPVFAALYRRDLELHAGSTCYAVVDERAGTTIAASALLA